MTRRPAVFLDRDGTLIEEKSYLTRPDQVRLLPGVGVALQRLRAAGFVCVVVTNQSAVGRGLMTEDDLVRVHDEMSRQLLAAGARVDAIYHCPLVPTTSDRSIIEHPERKPGPGMLQRAARELHLDLPASWMIGDQLSDHCAGRNAGCRGTILVRTGHPLEADGVVLVADLRAAADLILSHQLSAANAA
jgi:D-glycero-D-manno-heptose 1,7-bisphosphate phosphatase